MKITINKTIKYYNNKQFTHADIIPEKKVDTIDDALQYIKQTRANYIKNDNGISAIEEIGFKVGDGLGNFKKYAKTIDPGTGLEILTTPGGEA